MSREVVEETLLILQESQCDFLLDWSLPYRGGCSQVLISSKGVDSSICDWKINSPFSFGNITSFALSLFE